MKAAYVDKRTVTFGGHGRIVGVSDLYSLIAKLPNGAIVERISYEFADRHMDQDPGEIEIAIAAGKLDTEADD